MIDHSLHTFVKLIGRKWVPHILVSMQKDNNLRFSEIRRRNPGISIKVLSETLRYMEDNKLVIKKIYAEIPPRTEYTLTPLGKALSLPISAAQRIIEKHI